MKIVIKKQNWIQTYLPPLSCAASPRQPSLSSWTNPQISWKTWSLTTPHRLLFLNSFYFKVYQTHRTGVFSAGTTEDLTTDFISVPIPRIWSEMNPLSLSSEITTYCNEIVHFLSSLIRENSNFIAIKFQNSLWNPRINTNLSPINSFILFYNLLSQHKRFGRWSIGEQNDLHQNGISAKVGRVATELRRSNIVEASYNSRFLTLALRLQRLFLPSRDHATSSSKNSSLCWWKHHKPKTET